MSARRAGVDRGRARRRYDSALVSLALVTAGAGLGQFGAVAALGTVARHFGQVSQGPRIAAQAGLPPISLGAGLAIVWLASLGGMPLASLADRLGRRRILLGGCGVGLALTISASASPSYWWFVVIFAAGRPFLSAVYAVAQVIAAENASPAGRTGAIAMTAAGYGLGSGLIAIANGVAAGALGFRGVFALAAIPLILLPALGRRISEPDRFTIARRDRSGPPRERHTVARYRRQLLAVAGLGAVMGLVIGPVNGFLFVYAQNVRRLPGAAIAVTVVAAGVTGLAGLIAGRWLADRSGRRPAAAMSLAALAVAGMLTYAGPRWTVPIGYPMVVLTSSMWVPAVGALVNELFPTRLRGTAAGSQLAGGVLGAAAGLLAFGAMAAVSNRFDLAAEAVCLPVLAIAGVVFRVVPETWTGTPVPVADSGATIYAPEGSHRAVAVTPAGDGPRPG